MSLVYKNSVRENVTKIQTYIVDDSPKSTKYFRVSDVPQVLQKGKNLLRITAHPTNLVPGTQVYVDVRDSNGNAIYYEIPDYLENDKSRVISIWIYHDKGDDNTPNGEAIITLAGIANVDLNGNPLPSVHRNKINVKWQTTVTVDRERNNTSQIIFKDDTLPNVAVSQSIEQYDNQPQSNGELVKTTQTGKVKYLFSGTTPIIQTKDGTSFNGEMVGGDIILNNFTEPARPEATIENPLSSTFFSSSIKEILNGNTLKPTTNFTSSFQNREDLIHTYEFIKEADYSIEYIQSGSNVSTQNKRNFANLSFSNVDPITGIVSKIKVLQKSDGLPGDFELVNEVDVPFSSSFDIKVPIPSKNLKDPKILKLLYLNSEGSISRTETISEPFVFDGDNIYIGGEENLISGSIFISNTLGTGIEIGGASSGFIRSVGYRGITSASLGKAPGGFVIYSGSGNLKFGEDTLDGVGMEFVGDNDDRHLIFTTANGGLLDVKTDKFFIGNASSQFISGSDGNIEISSSIFHLNPSANSGAGSLIIGANATILADLTVDNLRTPAIINGNASTETNSSSSIKADGFARFVSASIGGWDITTASIEGGNLIMKPEGILQTRDFASGLKGWKISSEGNGTAEFENVRIRGTLRTTTFEKESVNAVGGQLWVANSTTITGSITATDTTMSVKNASGFSQGEILLIKKVDNTGFQTEYVLLESASIDGDNSNEDETHGRIMVSRAYGSGTSGDFVGDLASAAQVYEDGQVIVSTGKLNTGYIKMNANPNDGDTPFIDIVERTGSGLYDVALKARLGDLGGLANSDYVFGNANPGFGLATDNVFLQGGIIAKTGSIGGIIMDDGKLFTGEGTYNNSNTGFYIDSGSKFSLGNKLSWNPTTSTLTITGQLNFADGTSVESAIDAVSSGSIARTVDLAANKYVITFDADGNEAPSNQTITLTATAQNFIGNVYYEFYKDSTLQGSRSLTNTFTVDSTLEKPTASTPKSYEVKVFNSASGGSVISSDTLTLFGIQPGSDGAEGQDAVTTFLTNEAHTLPLSSSGAIQSYAGADTQMKVFEGITDKTSAYTFTESSPSHITATSSSNTFTITSTTTPHSGSVTITAASGSVSLSKIMSIGVTRQGDDGIDGTPGVNGDNAKTLIASVDSQVFAFDDSTDNSATPGSITFAFSQQNLNDTIQSSDITITTADSNSVTNFSFDNNSVSGPANQKSGIVSGSVSFTGGFSSGGLNGAKTSLPLTISCTNDSLTDSVTVFKVEGGADGAEGQDAVTTFLTNESHTLPSQNDGTVVSFTGASTDMEVFEGTTNKNSAYTFSRTSSTSVSSSISDNTITITSMAHDSGSVIITATSASVSLSKTMTLSKSKQGTAGLPGAAAKLLTLTSDSQVFAFPSASSSTPEDNDILIIVNQQNLSGTIDAGDITIKDAGGNTLTDPTFVASVTDGTGQVSGSITFGGTGSTVGGDKTKLPLTIEVAKDSLEDSLKIFKIDGGNEGQDGADAVTAFLTNESHTFAADSTGAIAVFTGGSTDMEVFEGITNVTSNYVISSSNGVGVTASDSGNTVTISAMAHDSGSVTINASSGSVSINKIMSLTKARQGVDGGDGTSAKLLIGSLDSQVMAFDDSTDTSATPTSIEFSFQQQNLSGSAGYLTLQSSDITIALNGGGNITNFDFDNNDVTNGTGIASGSISFTGNTNAGGMGGDKSKFPVTIAATKDGLNDTIKIFKVEGGDTGTAGTDAVTALLTNDSHTLPVSSSGNVISYAGANTDIVVFQGTSDVTNTYTINTGSVSSHITTTTNGDTVTVTESTTPFSGSVEITATSGSVVLSKTMTISQALQGDDGTDGTPGVNAKTITISSDTQTFAFDDSTDTSATPNQAVFSINQQNLSGAIQGTDITITKTGGGTITTPTVSGTVTNGTGTRTFTLPFSSLSKSDLPLSISVTKDSITDTTQIIKVEGGANGVSALQYLLTNEAHILPASSAGVVSSYSNSGTEIYVYEGTTELDYGGSGNGGWTISTPTVSPSGKITVGTISDGGNYAVVGNHSSMDNSTDSVTISYPISGKTTDGTSFSFTKTQTIAKSKAGTDGTPGDNAKLLALSATSQTFTFDDSTDTSATPSTISVSVNAQNLSAAVTNSDITITKNGGGTIGVPTLTDGSFDLTFDNGASTANGKVTSKSHLPLTISVSKDSQSDTITIFKVEGGLAGADAYTVFLTNESHTYPAAVNGDVDSNDLPAGATEVRVFKGTQQLTLDNSSPYGANTYRTSVSTSGITFLGTTVSNQRNFTPTAVANDTGTATITITDNTTGTAFTKTYTFSKSKEGPQGAQGSDSKTVALTAATNVITYDAAGATPSPSSTITLTADSQNFTDGYFKFTGDGITDEIAFSNGTSANQTTKSFPVPSNYFSSPKTIRVGVSEQANASTELTFDTVTIVAVKPGSQGIPGEPAFTKQFRYDDYDTNGNANGASRYTFQDPYSAASSYANNTYVRDDFSTATAVQFHKTDADGTDNSTYYDTLVVGDSFVYYISPDRWYQYTIATVDSNQPSNRYNFELTFVGENVEVAESQIPTTAGTDVHFRFQRAIDGTDGAAGADAVTAFLTSEADVVPAAADGTVSSFAGSGTTMKVFEGITDKTSAYTYTLVNTTTGLTAALSTNVLSVSALSVDSGSTDIRATSGSVTIEKTYSIGKSLAGATGQTGATGPNFDFLSGSLSEINTVGGIPAGLLMTSTVFGFHTPISQGSAPYKNAQLSDFTSFLDNGGNFYLGGNANGASGSDGGYFAWNNTDRSLLISGSKAQVEVDKFFLGNVGTQFISGSNGNIKISGDVEFEGKNSNGATVFYDDFSGNLTANQTFTTSNSPQLDGSGVGYYMFVSSGERSITTGQGEFSGRTAQFGNNSGNDEVWISSNKLIPFNENSLYEIEVRYKNESSDAAAMVYAGVTAYKPDGTTKCNTSGTSYAFADFSSQHYFASEGQTTTEDGSDWVIKKGYFKGTASSGNGGQHNSDTDPGTIHSNAINGYIAPMFLANFNDEAGRVKLDYIKLTEVGGGGSSKITGDSITTGTIKSNNLSTTVGTSLALDDGVMKIGGTGAYTSNNGILLDGPNAKFAVGNASGNYLRFNHQANKLEINADNFGINSSGEVTVNGSITVTNPNDFADPGANVTTEAVFEKFGGVSSPITSTNYYLGNLVQNLVTQTDGGTAFSGIKFEKNGSSNAWDAGFATKTTFTSSLEPIATIDIVLNQGVTGNSGADQYPPYQMFGFSDIDENTDITTTNNYPHITHGIYITRKLLSGDYYNTFMVRENAGAGVGASDYYTVTGISPSGTNGPWISGQDTFMRFTIQPKKGGGAIYKAFRNGNFLVPIWSYVTSTYEFTGNQSFFWSTYHGDTNGNRKELIFDQLSIGAAPPAGTVISGDGITAGTIVSTNLNANSGSQLLLDNGSIKLGGTTNPGFEVTEEGFVSATNLVEKAVVVTDANSGSYFETFTSGSTYTRLILDGSLGGEVTMNMSLESSPPYVISDLKFPANANIDTVAKLQLTILTQSVQFNEGTVSSGFSSFGLSLTAKSFGGGIS